MKLRKSLLILSASAILSAAVIAPDVALAQPFPGPPPGGGLAGPASPVVPPGHGAAGIADDMVRKWIEFKASAGVDKSDRIKALTDKFEAIRVQADIKTHIIHALGYGRSHLYLDTGSTDDKEELKTDLGTGARSAASAYKMPGKQLLGIRPIEPVWVSPHDYETSNPLKPNWYKPNAWHVMSNEVHASRLLTTIPFPVSDLLKPAYSFGGLPLIQLGKPYVDNWLNVRQGTTDIVLAYSIFALATEMGDVLSGGAGDNLEQRVALFNKWRSNKGTFVYDKNKEDFKNISANVAGIEAIQAASQEHMSAAWRIPLVKLTGISPSGLNASSEGEIRVYYDLIHSMQEQVIRPHIQIIMDLCSIELFGDVDDDISFDFVKLFEVTELEAAQIRSADAQTGSLLMQGQVISGEEERARVAEDPDTPYVDLDPLNPPQAAQLQARSGRLPRPSGRMDAGHVWHRGHWRPAASPGPGRGILAAGVGRDHARHRHDRRGWASGRWRGGLTAGVGGPRVRSGCIGWGQGKGAATEAPWATIGQGSGQGRPEGQRRSVRCGVRHGRLQSRRASQGRWRSRWRRMDEGRFRRGVHGTKKRPSFLWADRRVR
jgi:uncharacterized protein